MLTVFSFIVTTNVLKCFQIKDADTTTASNIALCWRETCVYTRQLEGYYLITSAKEASLVTIKSLIEDGLKQIKNFMDKCVQ